MNIILGITGSIAAYKTLELIRRRKKRGDDVKVILTRSAREFVTPLSCQTISNNEVFMEQFVLTKGIKHLTLREWGDILVIAPATANILGKAANGIADDLLSTTILSFTKRVLFVPAMDTDMWENNILQKNVRTLRDEGYVVLEPAYGTLASGREGKGHFPDIKLIDRTIDVVERGLVSLEGHNILISGGRTEEDVDPVRTVTNRSSGTMAMELLYAVLSRGGNARCVMGQTTVPMPKGYDIMRVRTAKEMLMQLQEQVAWCDCLIMAAAVGDYRPKSRRKDKIHDENLALNMVKNKDILKSLYRYKGNRYFIGFSLEDKDAAEKGKEKLKEKHLDMIILNGSAGIGTGMIKAHLLKKQRATRSLGSLTKRDCAHLILDAFIEDCTGKGRR